MAVVAGIDGCRAGWLCLTKHLSTGAVQARILTTIGALLDLSHRPQVVMVDMPIGLPDAGPRACDIAARAELLRPRASSVFRAPVRPMLAATTYARACRLGMAADGCKLSKQTWFILPKIRELDAFLREDPERNVWIREVHPEVSFRAWAGGRAMAHSKRKAAGRAEREALVEPVYGAAYAALQASLPRGDYANDDLLDAFAALWTGERVARGRERVLPARPPVDAFGLRMEIVV